MSPALSEGFVLGGIKRLGLPRQGRRGGLFALSFFVLPHFLVLILEEESVVDIVQ